MNDIKNFKQVLIFIIKCLTINKNDYHKAEVIFILNNKNINWDNVIKLSTAHLVFPALYINLQNCNLLSFVPNDLVEYMKYITDMNRARNKNLIEQVKTINNLLISNNIKPIYLKGIGNLLHEIYDDIGERMIGDIDILVPNDKFLSTIKLLKSNGYSENVSVIPKFHRHYAALVHENYIGAVEVHNFLLSEGYQHKFNYETIKNDIIVKNGFYNLSLKHQITHQLLAFQINDNGYDYKALNLKVSYDLFLLQHKYKKNQFNFNKSISKKAETYLYLTNYLFNINNHIVYETKHKKINKYVNMFYWVSNKNLLTIAYKKIIELKLKLKKFFKYFLYFFFQKNYRDFIIEKIYEKLN